MAPTDDDRAAATEAPSLPPSDLQEEQRAGRHSPKNQQSRFRPRHDHLLMGAAFGIETDETGPTHKAVAEPEPATARSWLTSFASAVAAITRRGRGKASRGGTG